MRKVYSVIINEIERDVWDIEGKEYDPGNGEPLTYWVYMGDRLPEGVTPSPDSDLWEHYHASIQRHLWDIFFCQKNTTKEKWNSTHFNSRTHVEMWCNKKLIYEFGTTGTSGGLSFAMAKVQYLQTMLSEHPYDFFDAKKNEGKKIYWKGLPATVKVKRDGWEIAVIPDYTAGLTKEEWWLELERREQTLPSKKEDEEYNREYREESKEDDCINWGDAFSDEHIDWFRK